MREREIEILCDGDRVHRSKGGGIEVEVVVLVKLFIIIMGRRDDVDSLVDFFAIKFAKLSHVTVDSFLLHSARLNCIIFCDLVLRYIEFYVI